MDPVRASITIVSLGIVVFQKVNEMRKTIKGAPEQLQSLEESCELVVLFLTKLQTANMYSSSDEDASRIDALCGRAQRYLMEVEELVDKITPGGSKHNGELGGCRIRKLKWLMKKDIIDEVSRKVKELQNTLALLVIMARLDSLDINTIEKSDSTQPQSSVNAEHVLQPASTRPVYSRPGTLRCLPDCTCRCHSPLVDQLVPGWLAPYIGQLSVSRRLLRPFWSSSNLCNVQTCRGDIQRVVTIQWSLPFGLLNIRGSLQYSKGSQIQLSISAPRTVPFGSPIINAVWHGDARAVHDLFAAGQASIWDHSFDGLSVFWYACYYWRGNPSDERLKIVQFFVEAGADTLFYEHTHEFNSAHDNLVFGLFAYLLRETDESKTIATVMRINPVAISIFRSLFNIDALDAIEHFLTRKRSPYVDVFGLMESLEVTACSPKSCASVIEAAGYSPLEYAIEFSPQNVRSLLMAGEDAAAEPTIVYAVGYARSDLIKLLLDAGADVNMRDRHGFTAMHWACSRCRYSEFVELLRLAESDIDWDARTPDGRVMLELFDSAVQEGRAMCWSQSQVNEVCGAVVSHSYLFGGADPITSASGGPGRDVDMMMPGAFPDLNEI